jgi:hypothetical protein
MLSSVFRIFNRQDVTYKSNEKRDPQYEALHAAFVDLQKQNQVLTQRVARRERFIIQVESQLQTMAQEVVFII